MIISKDFIIDHRPKMAGHALAVMLDKAGVEFEHPFDIKGNKAVGTDEKKHVSFRELWETRPEVMDGRPLYSVIRRLPDWTLSILWHQSKHTMINENNRVAKWVGESAYHSTSKERPGFLHLPDISACFCLGDASLKKYNFESQPINYLRMEYLRGDIKKHLNIKLAQSTRYHSYHEAILDHYWTDEARALLYRNNPMYAELEKEVYGSLDV